MTEEGPEQERIAVTDDDEVAAGMKWPSINWPAMNSTNARTAVYLVSGLFGVILVAILGMEARRAIQDPVLANLLLTIVVLGFVVILSLLIYFAPTFIAIFRKHPNWAALSILNFFLGWTLVGWVVALVWAFTIPTHTITHIHVKE
jgi:uncharacterized membrane protein